MKWLVYVLYGLWLPLLFILSFRTRTGGVTTRAYEQIWQDPYLVEACLTTFWVGIVVALCNLVVGALVGRTLAWYQGKYEWVWDVWLSFPLIIPALVITSGLHLFMIKIGIVDTIFAVFFIHLLPTLPYSIRLFRNTYEQLGEKWYEQAQLLGASKVRQFFTITLPMLRSVHRTAFLFAFAISMSQYALTAFIGGGEVTTLALLFYPYFSSADEGIVAAFSLLFFLFPLVAWGVFEWGYIVLRKIGRRDWIG